jgi:hypothetical protein
MRCPVVRILLRCVCGDTRGKTREIDRCFPGRIWRGYLIWPPFFFKKKNYSHRMGRHRPPATGDSRVRRNSTELQVLTRASCIVMTHLLSDGRCINANRP